MSYTNITLLPKDYHKLSKMGVYCKKKAARQAACIIKIVFNYSIPAKYFIN